MSLAIAFLPALRSMRMRYKLGQKATLNDLIKPLGRNASAIGAALMALPLTTPMNLGPITFASCVVMIIIGWGMIKNRSELILPLWVQSVEVPEKAFYFIRRIITILAKFRHVSMRTLSMPALKFYNPEKVTGFGIVTGAVLILMPIPVPGANSFPALGVIMFSQYLIKQNPLYLLAGIFCYFMGLVVFALIIWIVLVLGISFMDIFFGREPTDIETVIEYSLIGS